MRVCYLDCFSGIAGDMLLGALVDAGLELQVLQDAVAQVGLDGIALRTERVQRGGLAGTKVHVDTAPDHPHRSLATIERILDGSALDPEARDLSLRVFRRLGEAEAQAHAIPIEKVHFHEVGALDAIADVVGACVGFRALGVERIHCSPVNLGSGTVQAAHGTLPVPAPATARLMEGVPTYAEGPAVELTTPTGAALAATLAASFGAQPAMRIAASGYGAGTGDFPGRPNLLRILLGDTAEEDTPPEQVWVLEANVDDMTPEMAGYALDRLLAAGALDVTLTPVQMKKNRPGFTLAVLAAPDQRAELGDLLLAETTTLGIRETAARRRTLPRSWEEVRTRFGSVRIKTAGRAGAVANFAPEYEDCRRRAAEHGVPFKQVWHEASHEYLRARET